LRCGCRWWPAAWGPTGILYTLLTGAEVPTVRSCLGALLVLGAVALGRQPLSIRLLATAALIVMVLWPEAVVGPSFQMSLVGAGHHRAGRGSPGARLSGRARNAGGGALRAKPRCCC
jgi:competence protein ComEC